MAVELAVFGINVNVICPGTIDSGAVPESMKTRALKTVPQGRLGRPEEIANMVVFLASPAADYLNGSVIIVDGGASRVAI
jgi:3-oxoacyl-[acyl-carrier protein] reductase